MTRPPLDLHLYLVTDTSLCGGRSVLDTVREAVRGGVTAVQVREPHTGTRELRALVAAVHEVLAGTGVPLFVNDRLDVALAVGAEGVHLGQGDLAPLDARRVAGAGLLVGLSVSTLAQAEEANRLPSGCVDYLGVGPVFATATKTDAADPLGLDGTARVSRSTRLPCVAIGGVTTATASAVRATGVDGVAVVSAICGAPDVAGAASYLRGDR